MITDLLYKIEYDQASIGEEIKDAFRKLDF